MNYNLKRFIGLFFYTIIIGFILNRALKYQTYLKTEMTRNLDFTTVITFTTFFPVAVGVFLGFPKLIKVITNSGTWQFDWIKFLAIGLPTLYITLTPLLFYPHSPLKKNILGSSFHLNTT